MIKIQGVSQLEGKDSRFIESCFRVLDSHNVKLPLNFETPVEGASILNKFIASREKTSTEKEVMVQSLIAEANQSLISLDEFN